MSFQEVSDLHNKLDQTKIYKCSVCGRLSFERKDFVSYYCGKLICKECAAKRYEKQVKQNEKEAKIVMQIEDRIAKLQHIIHSELKGWTTWCAQAILYYVLNIAKIEMCKEYRRETETAYLHFKVAIHDMERCKNWVELMNTPYTVVKKIYRNADSQNS